MIMTNQGKSVRPTALVLVACGLIASVLPGFAAEPAGPQWSWGLPVYEIATRYYSEIGGFKEIEKDIPQLKSLHVGIIYLMPVHPCSEDTSRDAQMAAFQCREPAGLGLPGLCKRHAASGSVAD
jgi:hypothetical protein